MYPEDQQPQPPNQNTIGEAPKPFMYGEPVGTGPTAPKKKPKDSMSWLPWAIGGVVLFVVLLVAVIILIMNAGKDNNKASTNTGVDTNTNTNSDVGADECTAKERRYQNEDLDMRFCYPTTWGDVKLADGKFDPSDGGTREMITFADKPQLHLGLASDDWSTDSGKTPSCASPSIQAFPSTEDFSAKWVAQGPPKQATSALRGLEVVPDSYLLQEEVDNTTINGVCLEGFKAFDGEVYRNAEATYYVPFSGKTTTPQAHITNPILLISVADRTDFTNFVKSIQKY
ncbi:MAG TPA: hypothetical protein VLA92_01405 [Candidatus Saccharimonadales bacterium]|nr:hypothetical protein [Candidatus Saccharimonadales bacterium]